MTKTNTNKELAQRLHKEVWEQGSLDLIDELVAEDYVEHSTGMRKGCLDEMNIENLLRD